MTAFDDGLWARLVDEHGADRVALGAVPQQRSRRRLLVGVSGVVAASGAGVIAAVLSLAGGAGTAFAGWTPQPTTPTAAQLTATEAYCAANVPSPGLPLKLVDARDRSRSWCTRTGPRTISAPPVPHSRTRRGGAPHRR